MGFSGTWDVTVQTPMGAQQSVLVLRQDGTELSGESTSGFGTTEFAEGSVTGDSAEWTLEVSVPFPMSLKYEVRRDVDALTGRVRAGDFGTSPLKGKRRG